MPTNNPRQSNQPQRPGLDSRMRSGKNMDSFRFFLTFGINLPALMVFVFTIVPAYAADSGLSAPQDLRFDNQVEPLGMALRQARFSWLVKDTRRGAMQSAYRVVVSTDSTVSATGPNLVWDSGKVASDRSIQVPYGGPTLKPRQRYFWKVQTFDAADVPSPWSAVSWWEMPTDGKWKAVGITMPRVPVSFVPEPDVFWINNARVFTASTSQAAWRQQFILPREGTVTKAILHVAASASSPYVIYFNGKKAAAGDPTSTRFGHDAWHNNIPIRQHDVAGFLQNGLNTIAVAMADSGGNGRREIAFAAEIRMADGSGLNIETDEEWRFNPAPENGWEQPAFNDSQWKSPNSHYKIMSKKYFQTTKDPRLVGGFVTPPCAPASDFISPKDSLKPLVLHPRTHRPILLRKEFDLPIKPKRARAYVSAWGACEMTINGKPASDDVLAPNREGDRYVTYDVTDLLVSGRNCIGATAAGGYASGHDSEHGSWPIFFMQIEADLGDQSLVQWH